MVQGRAFAVAATSPGNNTLRLIEVDTSGLGMTKQADAEIARADALWANGNNLYTLVKAGPDIRLARYGLDLAQAAISGEAAHPQAVVFFSGGAAGALVSQAADGRAILLDPLTLK
jgi:hypothetical protein